MVYRLCQFGLTKLLVLCILFTIIIILSYAAEKDNSRIHHSIRRVKIGCTIYIHCHSYGDTIWFFGIPQTKGEIKRANTPELMFQNIQLKDGGDYFCFGLNNQYGVSGLLYKHFLAKVTVKVYGKWS